MILNSEAASNVFPQNFDLARTGFRHRVRVTGGTLHSIGITAKGPNGEELTIDVAWFGAEAPARVLVHSSGLHGVEGFAGSAIQQACLQNGLFDAARLPADGAVVIMHVCNPFGMAWLRRWNENNVDLNRNFRYGGTEDPLEPRIWPELNALANPPTAPGRDLYWVRALSMMGRHGESQVRQALAGGQCLNPKGLFYVGRGMEEGPRKIAAFLNQRLQSAEQITAIDIHTGLGRFGEDCLLMDTRLGSERLAAAREQFGECVQPLSRDGVAYSVEGSQQDLYNNEFPCATTLFLTQEFGTYWGPRVLKTLREENRWHWYGGRTLDHWSKRALTEAFNPRSVKWRETVIRRGLVVAEQALRAAFGAEQV